MCGSFFQKVNRAWTKKSLSSRPKGSGVIAFLAVVGSYILLVLWPQLQWTLDVRDPYLNVMKRSNSPEYKAEIKSWFDRTYNLTELYEWVNEKLEFVPVGISFERHTDPNRDRTIRSGKVWRIQHTLRCCMLSAWLPKQDCCCSRFQQPACSSISTRLGRSQARQLGAC